MIATTFNGKNVSNHYAVHVKLTQYYVSVIFQ